MSSDDLRNPKPAPNPTPARILDAALALLREGGPVRMSDIAKAAGVSRQAVYLHFPTRAQLLIAAARRLDCPVRLEGFGMQAALTSSGDLVLGHDWQKLVTPASLDITFILGGTTGSDSAQGLRAHTADTCWRNLNQFAARTYAPESEESRRRGAGSEMPDSE